MQPLTLALCLPLLTAACIGVREHDGSARGAPAAASTAKAAKDEAPTTAEKLEKKQREIGEARMALEIARQETAAAEREAGDALAFAEHDLVQAQSALKHFDRHTEPLEMKQAALGLDRMAWRLEETRQELAELEAMYQQDELATLTKELVLQRSRKQIEFAERALASGREEAAAKQGHELPRKRAELEVATRKAEAKLREARASKQRTGAQNELKLKKAERAVVELEEDIGKLEQQRDAKPDA